MGFVGFLYELENYGFGFFIVLYVVVKDCYRYYMKNKFLLGYIFKNEIVYLFWLDNNEIENKVGEVVKVFFGEYRFLIGVIEGLDLVVVRILFIFRLGGIIFYFKIYCL